MFHPRVRGLKLEAEEEAVPSNQARDKEPKSLRKTIQPMGVAFKKS